MIIEKVLQASPVKLWRNLAYIRCYSGRKVEGTDFSTAEEWDSSEGDDEASENQKLIRVAIVGVPNAGKSTLINELVDHRVCPVSSKVHTTRNYSRAIRNLKNTQIIFYDTPGMISDREVKKHQLESTFLSAYRHSIQNSDIIGVVHDVSNSYTRTALNKSILQALEEYKNVPALLILNKIDALKSKRILLDLVRHLTQGCLSGESYGDRFKKPKASKSTPPVDEAAPLDNKGTWPLFKEVFMISALNGDGVYRLMNYLSRQAKPQPWIFKEENKFTDQDPEQLIVQSVRARLLDYLPQEIPYQLKCEMEFFSAEKGEIFASVLVTCPNPRLEKLVCGVKNGKLKQITECCTSDLIESFQVPVSLTISTMAKIKPTS